VRVRGGISGLRTIGKRVVDAVATQPDLELAGVAKARPSYETRRAIEKGTPLCITGAGNFPELL